MALSQRESWCREVNETPRNHKDKDNKDRSGKKEKASLSFPPQKHGGGGKGASSINRESPESRRLLHSDTRKESGWRRQAKRQRKPSKENRRRNRPPVRNVNRKASSVGAISSSKKATFHCYSFKIVIYTNNEYRDHFNSKTYHFEMRRSRREERVLRQGGRSSPPLVCQSRRAPRSPKVAGAKRGSPPVCRC